MKEGALFVCKLSSSKIAARASRQRSTQTIAVCVDDAADGVRSRMMFACFFLFFFGSAHNGNNNHKNADGLCTRAMTSAYDYVTQSLALSGCSLKHTYPRWNTYIQICAFIIIIIAATAQTPPQKKEEERNRLFCLKTRKCDTINPIAIVIIVTPKKRTTWFSPHKLHNENEPENMMDFYSGNGDAFYPNLSWILSGPGFLNVFLLSTILSYYCYKPHALWRWGYEKRGESRTGRHRLRKTCRRTSAKGKQRVTKSLTSTSNRKLEIICRHLEFKYQKYKPWKNVSFNVIIIYLKIDTEAETQTILLF